MTTQEPSFKASWRQFSSEKGWFKVLLLLGLVGWVPILGQIVVLGYSFEWARRTAWGMNVAPKKTKIDYGKLMATGGICFLVLLCFTLVFTVLESLVFGEASVISWIPASLQLNVFSDLQSRLGISSGVQMDTILWIALSAVSLFVCAFIMCCMMRSTIYDSFTAGFRFDRLWEMVKRDSKGFCKIALTLFLGYLVVFAYELVVFGSLALMLIAGLLSMVVTSGAADSYYYYNDIDPLVNTLANSVSVSNVILILVFIIVLVYVAVVLMCAMQMVCSNATAQWFAKFEVNRWGKSEDPLPADVPAPTNTNSMDAVYGNLVEPTPQRPVAQGNPADVPAQGNGAASVVQPEQPAGETTVMPERVVDKPEETTEETPHEPILLGPVSDEVTPEAVDSKAEAGEPTLIEETNNLSDHPEVLVAEPENSDGELKSSVEQQESAANEPTDPFDAPADIEDAPFINED